jgi:hypothetical protein
MKPGATIMPLASMIRRASEPENVPISAILPLRIPTSPEYQGDPLPSTILPLRMTTSNGGSALQMRKKAKKNRSRKSVRVKRDYMTRVLSQARIG